MKKSKYFGVMLLIALFITVFSSCKDPETVDEIENTAPTMVSSTPSNNETNVNVSSSIVIVFSENIVLKANAVIALNDIPIYIF